MTVLRAIAFTGVAWGLAFACTWAIVTTLGGEIR
jgi:hypothetical protein